MAITYTWKVTGLGALTSFNGESTVIYEVYWALTGDDGDGHIASTSGTQGVSLDLSDGFTPFADLTEAQVLGWVFGGMGGEAVGAHEAFVAQRIADQIAPTIVSPELPWA